jgi:hypothetical protein
VPKQQRCKACRLQACKNAGMTYYQKSWDFSSEDESKKDDQQTEAEDISISITTPACPNFDILAKAYTEFTAAQQVLFTNLHFSTNIPLGHIGDLMVMILCLYIPNYYSFLVRLSHMKMPNIANNSLSVQNQCFWQCSSIYLMSFTTKNTN